MSFIRVLVRASTLVFVLLALPSFVISQNRALPNIVFIIADDLGYGDTGPYGQKTISTPILDAFAKQGMKFMNFYAGSTVCAPSRSALMTGLHTGHTRVRGNAHVPLQAADTTIVERIKAAGYSTALIGKWGLGEAGSSGIPTRKGFDHFYGYLNQTHAHNYYTDHLWNNEQLDSIDNVVTYVPGNGPERGGAAVEKKTYSQDVFLHKTLQFLDDHKHKPFFLYLPFILPHANNEALRLNQSGMEVPNLGAYANKDWPYHQKAHAAMISYLDMQVGKILDKLRQLGLEENTIVVFTSDNGPHNEGGAKADFFNSNGSLRGIKRDMYEGGIRVPFIVRWPGKVKAGSTANHVAAFWDLMPTLCEIAGVTAPGSTDGISFLPTLRGKPQRPHDYLYWEFFEEGGKRATRFGQWKLIELNVNRAPSTFELYRLSDDPGERRNVAAKYPRIVEQGIAIMKNAHQYSPDFNFTYERKGAR